jgi:hypothetical protein
MSAEKEKYILTRQYSGCIITNVMDNKGYD